VVIDPVLRPVAFISYRRSKDDRPGGSTEARLLRETLARKGWHAFLDVEDLGPGEWSQQLLKVIGQRPVFILVLSKDALNPVAADDPFLGEIKRAVDKRRHIILVLLPGFEPPPGPTIGEEVNRAISSQGVNYSHEHFGSTIENLDQLIRKALARRRSIRSQIRAIWKNWRKARSHKKSGLSSQT
jgi:hypothetical protein